MATMNFSVPDDVKDASNAAFERQNKSALLTQMMREAVARAQEPRRRESAARRMLSRWAAARH